MKLVTVVGARPQFVKAAVVSRAICEQKYIEEILIHTGQHYDPSLSAIFFEQLGMVEPTYVLSAGGLSHGAMTGRMLEHIEKILLDVRADGVLVYGDTNSTLAGALAAAKLGIPVAHVEAGLRSFNRSMPEEINRVMTDHASDLLFAPTDTAVDNLNREGIRSEYIHFVGDVMYDASLIFSADAIGKTKLLDMLEVGNDYVLVTIHRAENTDDSERLLYILENLARIAQDRPVLFPVHPRTRKAINRIGETGRLFSGILFMEPVSYLDMLMLEKNAALIITDSGGVQKEAYFCGVGCIVVRRETEWTELVTIGGHKLVPAVDNHCIAEAASMLLDTTPRHDNRDLYGGGKAAKRIAEVLREWHG